MAIAVTVGAGQLGSTGHGDESLVVLVAVSDKAALNAGIAHGFNKDRGTAARAAFTIGW